MDISIAVAACVHTMCMHLKPVPHYACVCAAPRQLRYADLGGIEEVLADIRELIEYPLKHPEVRQCAYVSL